LPRIDHVLVSTSPPMCSMAAIVLRHLRGTSTTFWVMDINPDQLVAAGGMRADALPVRAFDWANRQILARAHNVVALDRYMAERLNRKLPVGDRMTILPPWPHVDVTEPVLDHAHNEFRREHGFGDAFVLMYSGNLSPVHPVDTVLAAALRLRSDSRIAFVFIGGGLGKTQIERYVAQHGLDNVRLLPYQPLSSLRQSLSAADVHLVAMGETAVGIVHPCKVYGAMAVGRPVFVLGPRRCHLSDIVLEHDIGWQVDHGDVEGAVAAIEAMRDAGKAARAGMGNRARALVERQFSRRELCGRLCDLLAST
jgi:glycosyltransferase involved in cell wall biosynthesis